MNKKEKDFLNVLFQHLPQEELPDSFRQVMMRKVLMEAVRIKKRNERWALASIIVASCLMIGLAIFAFLRLEVDKVNFSFPEVSFSSFYLYIGGLVFILLGIDHWIRQLYKKKQQDEPI